MDQVKKIADEQKDRLTGATLYARCREVYRNMRINESKCRGDVSKRRLECYEQGGICRAFRLTYTNCGRGPTSLTAEVV